MSEKFIVDGGLSIPSGKSLEIGDTSLSSIVTLGGAGALSGASASAIPSEYSVKEYVDNAVSDNNQWTLSDGTNTTSVDSDETLTVNGTSNEIEVAVSQDGDAITFGLPDEVTINTLTVSTSAILADGSQLASTASPTADTDLVHKKYVDDLLGASSLGLVTDDNGVHNASIDLDSESLSILGTDNEIESKMSADNTIKIGLPDTVNITTQLNTAALSATGASNLNGNVTIGGSLDIGSGAIEGSADEMILSADGDETSASGSASNSMTLNASAGIFTNDLVTMKAGFEMDLVKKDEFSVMGAGSATQAFSFDASVYKSAKLHVRIDDGTDFTAKEILVVAKADGSSAKFVEYGTVNTNSEIANTWTLTNSSGTVAINVDSAAGTTVKGTYELIK